MPALQPHPSLPPPCAERRAAGRSGCHRGRPCACARARGGRLCGEQFMLHGRHADRKGMRFFRVLGGCGAGSPSVCSRKASLPCSTRRGPKVAVCPDAVLAPVNAGHRATAGQPGQSSDRLSWQPHPQGVAHRCRLACRNLWPTLQLPDSIVYVSSWLDPSIIMHRARLMLRDPFGLPAGPYATLQAAAAAAAVGQWQPLCAVAC